MSDDHPPPPLPIPLTSKQLQAIGETCAIFGQIDLFMQSAVCWLLNVPVLTAAAIMGSTDIRARSGIFEKIMLSKCRNPEARALLKPAIKGLTKLSSERNDFVHAYYGLLTKEKTAMTEVEGIHFGAHPDTVPGGPSGIPVAIRSRSRTHVPAKRIEGLRDEAAILARLIHQIHELAFADWWREHRASLDKSERQPPPHPANQEQN